MNLSVRPNSPVFTMSTLWLTVKTKFMLHHILQFRIYKRKNVRGEEYPCSKRLNTFFDHALHMSGLKKKNTERA